MKIIICQYQFLFNEIIMKYIKTNLKMLIGIVLFLSSGSVINVIAQNATVKGVVRDETNAEVAGATIEAKNTTTGFTAGGLSDSIGLFQINNLPAGGPYTFTISSIGYKTESLTGYTLKGGATTSLVVKLSLAATGLEQVVVTGYSSQRKGNITGAVTVVNVEDLQNTPSASIEQALQGRVAGVNVMSSGQPGAGVAVRIRGVGTINSNDPLYVVDGIPMTTDMNTINPDEIESMQVLKDASAASIYGSRASNGVVVITTKTAKGGKSQLDYRGYIGMQKVGKIPQLMNTNQFANAYFRAFKNEGLTPPEGNPYGTGDLPVIPEFIDIQKTTPAGNTNWYSEIFRPSLIHSHSITMLNGSDKGNTALTLGYYDQQGIMKYSNFKRYSARFNSEYTFFKKLKIGEFASLTYSESQNVSENRALGSVLNAVYFADPIVPVHDINGNLAGPANNTIIPGRSPIAILATNRDNLDKKWKLLGKVYAELEIIRGLNLKTNFSVDYTNFDRKRFTPTSFEGVDLNNTNSLNMFTSYNTTQTFTNLLEYIRRYGKHSINALVGTEYISFRYQNLRGGRSDFPLNDPAIQQLDAGQSMITNSSIGYRSALWSQFAKADYEFDRRYLLSATIRNDATSRLMPGNNSQVFPAFSLGWRLSRENFMRDANNINELKIRFGWGQTGNQEISNYPIYSTYAINLNNTYYDIAGTNSTAVPGYAQQTMGNPLLRWETATQTNIGLDFTAFRNAFNFTLDFFDKKTSDLLVSPRVPAVMGASTPPYINGGAMRNKGVELSVGYKTNVTKDLNVSVDGNFAYIKNELTALTDELAFIPSPVSNTLTRNLELQRTVIGQPVAAFYGYKTDGVFKNQQEVDAHATQTGKAIGRLRYVDVDGNGLIDDNDRTFLGSPVPTFNYGFNLKLLYKDFDFWAFFQGAGGNKIYEFSRIYTDFFASPATSNKSVRLLDAWSPENLNSNTPALSIQNNNNETRPSDYFLQDGNYLRFKTLQLGYTLPTSFLRIKNRIRIYAQAQNLFTFTKYTGMDPEIGLTDYDTDSRNLDVGVDRGIYPVSKTYMFGIAIKL